MIRFWPRLRLGETCQFADEFQDGKGLVEIAGHCFCPYHLPFNEQDFAEMTKATAALSEKDKAKLKSAWSKEKQKAFNQAILNDKVEPARQADELCDLTGVVFPGVFSAKEVTFPAISFAYARFSGGAAWFRSAQFSGGAALFQDAQFSGGDAEFDKAQFSGGAARFRGAQFSGGDAEFHDAQFSGGRALFKESRFSGGYAWFTGARFSGGAALFDKAQFSGGDAWFDDAQFSGGHASFSGARFEHDATFDVPAHDTQGQSGAERGDFDFRQVDFVSVRFNGDVNFENRRFTRKTSFKGARFATAPDFHGCALHQDTTFPPTENFRGRKEEEAVRAYRTLKLAMGQHRATAEEGMFWALEQIATRSTLQPWGRLKKELVPWLLSWAYHLGSLYGLSVTRPLVLFLVSTLFVFPIVFWSRRFLCFPSSICLWAAEHWAASRRCPIP